MSYTMEEMLADANNEAAELRKEAAHYKLQLIECRKRCEHMKTLEGLSIDELNMRLMKGNSNKSAADKLLSCILSVRQQNTEEWMRGIADDINAYAQATGDTDRVMFDGDGLRIMKGNL